MFNFSRFAADAPAGAITDMWNAGQLDEIGKNLNDQGQDALAVDRGQNPDEFNSNDLQNDQTAEQADMLVDEFTLKQAQSYLFNQGQEGRTVWYQLINELAADDVAHDSRYRAISEQLASEPELAALEPQLAQQAEQVVMNGPLGQTIQKLLTIQRTQQGSAMMQPVASKIAQVQPLKTDVADKGPFVARYIDALLAYNGKKGPEDAQSELAKNEILEMVSPAAHEEVNSPLEEIQGLSAHIDQQKAEQYLAYVFDNWIAPAAVECQMQPEPQPMEPVMSDNKNPKGIIKFNLSEQVLNNSHTVVKTAADQFGQQYLLYGPTEKRICPKLRGKGGGCSGSGDVVSEYTCRHHCLDGIVIDDNKTICGEALWRANAMDKYSREYVDADGDIKGGYLNKRFEVNRNVPEENKMRLKPGETRKPHPPEWGNTESRMQAMRKAEGKNRDYRPDTNTGDPFEWCQDADQNNVQQSQSTRDSREEASGHQTVQYTNKNKQENNPKVASRKGFNLARVKTADVEMGEILEPYEELQTIIQDSNVELPLPEETSPEQIDKLKKIRDKAVNNGKHQASFNMNRFAQGGSISPVPDDGGRRSPDGRLGPTPFDVPTCHLCGAKMGKRGCSNPQCTSNEKKHASTWNYKQACGLCDHKNVEPKKKS